MQNCSNVNNPIVNVYYIANLK